MGKGKLNPKESNVNSKVTVNGHTYDLKPGDVVLVIGNDVRLNYQIVNQNSKPPEVKLEGDPLSVHCVGDLRVTGNSGKVDVQGNVTVGGGVNGGISSQGNVTVTGSSGNIDAQGTVKVDGNSGKIEAQGNVTVGGDVNGKIEAQGNVTGIKKK
jgi:putative transposon-encoded protein